MQDLEFRFSNYQYGTSSIGKQLSIFADRPHVLGQLREDALAAGFGIVDCGTLSALPGEQGNSGADVILIDCPILRAADIAALARLDTRSAESGTHMIVATSVLALDDVFGCLDQSNPQILVDPSQADWVLALGRVLARIPGASVRELSEEDRMVLLRMTEQVSQIAQRLERLETPLRQSDADSDSDDNRAGAFRFESPRRAFVTAGEDGSDRLVRTARLPLPDPRLIRRIIRQRQLRARFFDGDLFADPAWDMLLDLTAARAEHTRVSITSLCIASGVPPTTALRWIGQLIDGEMFLRVEDETDRRRAFITLSDRAADGMARYFAELGSQAARTV